jgi:hypothetical protein
MSKMVDSKSFYPAFDAQILEILLQNRGGHPEGSVPSGGVSLETGLIFPRSLVTVLPAKIESPPPIGPVVDGAGHSRPIYAPLLVYAWLRAAEGAGIPMEPVMAWCEWLEANLATGSGSKNPAAIAWSMLALHVAAARLGHGDWIELAAVTFAQFAHDQQADGALLKPQPGTNPETRWYDELVLLHAMSSYAVETHDPAIASAVNRAAEFNMMEMQPDHATQQPWALFAFHSNLQTRIQAEQILHTAIMHGRTNLDAISLILLADALWCARSG